MSNKHDLIEKQFPVLNDGFVALMDVMGTDTDIVDAARVSYGKQNRQERFDDKARKLFPGINISDLSSDAHQKVSDAVRKDDATLLRYLMRKRHSTPFEMAELKFLVRCPMDCWRQWIRHRTANVNEYSTRYTEAIDSCSLTLPGEWRLQATNNKQGSGGSLEEWPEGWTTEDTPSKIVISCPEKQIKFTFMKSAGDFTLIPTPGQFLSYLEKKDNEHVRDRYELRLDLGVAKEQARKDLPLSTYTEAYWKIDLHNLLHFLGLRMDSHAQYEIRQYATVIGEQIVKPLFPITWKAFEDYRLNATYLTALESEVIKDILVHVTDAVLGIPIPLNEFEEQCSHILPEEWLPLSSRNRERDECIEKLKAFHIID